jgi:hypothetical protein
MTIQSEQVAHQSLVSGGQTTLHSHAGGGTSFVTKVLATADTTNSAVALANCSSLSFAVVSDRFYGFNFYVYFTTPLATVGLALSLNAPANNYILFNTFIPVTSIAAKTFNYSAVSAFVASTGVPVASAKVMAMLDGLIQPTAPGNVIIRFATAEASQRAVIKAGSAGVLYNWQVV